MKRKPCMSLLLCPLPWLITYDCLLGLAFYVDIEKKQTPENLTYMISETMKGNCCFPPFPVTPR